MFTVEEAFPTNHECSLFGINGPEHRLALNTRYAIVKDVFPDEQDEDARGEAYWGGVNELDVSPAAARRLVSVRYLAGSIKKHLAEGCRYFNIKGFSKMTNEQMASAIMGAAMARVQH